MYLVRRIILLAISLILALALAAPVALGQVGQGSKASGTAEELAADWWTWALSKPVSENPLVGEYTGGPQCDGQPVTETQGKKWFLAGAFGGGPPVERTCTMPVGTQLFFPVANYVFVITEPGENEQVAREAVNGYIDSVLADAQFSMSVTVDGKQVKNNRIVRTDSPLFSVDLPTDNVFGVPQVAGPHDAVADGLWAALPPLSKGEHTIHIEASAPSLGFTQDVTYTLNVVPGKKG
jgi:hypothetical protein